jgi:hypothetical protein
VSGQLRAPTVLNPKKHFGALWIESWVGRRAGLDAVAKTKKSLLCPCRESHLGSPAHSLVTTLTEIPQLPKYQLTCTSHELCNVLNSTVSPTLLGPDQNILYTQDN